MNTSARQTAAFEVVTTRIEKPAPSSAHVVSCMRVQWDSDRPDSVFIHVWSRGGGAGLLSFAIEDAPIFVQRFFGDLDGCVVTQDRRRLP